MASHKDLTTSDILNVALDDVLCAVEHKFPQAIPSPIIGGTCALAKMYIDCFKSNAMLYPKAADTKFTPIIIHAPTRFSKAELQDMQQTLFSGQSSVTVPDGSQSPAPFKTTIFSRRTPPEGRVDKFHLRFMGSPIDFPPNNLEETYTHTLVDMNTLVYSSPFSKSTLEYLRKKGIKAHKAQYLTWPAVIVEQLVLAYDSCSGDEVTTGRGIRAALMVIRWAVYVDLISQFLKAAIAKMLRQDGNGVIN
ncbi:hypothetical protein JCM3770_001374 [Rhodotorula araucariae]